LEQRLPLVARKPGTTACLVIWLGPSAFGVVAVCPHQPGCPKHLAGRVATAASTSRHWAKIHLEHVYSAVALNLICLDAWWRGRPLDRARTSHLTASNSPSPHK